MYIHALILLYFCAILKMSLDELNKDNHYHTNTEQWREWSLINISTSTVNSYITHSIYS